MVNDTWKAQIQSLKGNGKWINVHGNLAKCYYLRQDLCSMR